MIGARTPAVRRAAALVAGAAFLALALAACSRGTLTSELQIRPGEVARIELIGSSATHRVRRLRGAPIRTDVWVPPATDARTIIEIRSIGGEAAWIELELDRIEGSMIEIRPDDGG